MNKTIKLGILVLLVTVQSYSQNILLNPSPTIKNRTALLPDISILGNIVGKISSYENDSSKDKILPKEIEVAFQGYLYPSVRSDIFFSLHRHENEFKVDLEEANVTFLKLWDNFSLKVGKSLIDFGKINKVHQHERPYVDQPMAITTFLGEHGLSGEGFNLSYLFPIPIFLQIDAGYWWVALHEHGYEEKKLQTAPLIDINGENIEEILVPKENAGEFSLADKVYSNRLWSSFGITKDSELEIGFSFVRGMGSHYLHHKDETQIFGFDLTYKLFPLAFKKIIFQTEVLKAIREVPIGILERYGMYNYLGYQVSKFWVLGLRYDWTENIFPTKETRSSISAIITRNLTETTKLRLQYNRFLEEQEISEGYLQIVFGLGPHSHVLQ